MKKYFLAILLLPLSLFAQTDTSFWFAAPAVSSVANYDRPIHLRIAAYQQPCTVVISQPAGGGVPTQTLNIPANTMQSIDLTTWINNIECGPGDLIENKGLKITSNNNIAVYYEVNTNGPNPELFALKGRNALGNEFYISSQYILDNAVFPPQPVSAFNIVASENNTSVTITPTNAIIGHAANVPFTITLNKGQTYSATAVSLAAAQHLQGSHVTSTKPVAITLVDDLLQGGPVYGGVCQDLAGDQTVPVNIIGKEYIAVRSQLNAPFDKIYITATQNGTSLTQDGVFVTNLNAGQSRELSMTSLTTYIQSSAPVYAYQLSGIGCEVGSTILPKINCTGSSSVSIARSTNESFIATILVGNGGQSSFLVNNASGVITAAQFSVVPGTGGAYYYAKVTLPLTNYPNGSVINISNSATIFQLGIFQGGVLSGTAVGYFSDYKKSNVSNSQVEICRLDSAQLNAFGGVTYQWTPAAGLSNPGISNPKASPSVTTNYKVIITDVIGCVDSAFVKVLVNTDCIAPDSIIVNKYTPVLSLDICKNIINVENATDFNVGDTVLMIQMKGAVIDSTNTATFGSITDYKNAGNYEFNYVKSKTGNVLEFKNVLTRQYDIPIGKVQLIKVPYYYNTNFDKVLTCLPWDGNKGGVLVLNVRDTINLNADIDVSGRGFRGGKDPFTNPSQFYCYEDQFFYPVNPDLASGKGEGIALISDSKSFGKGALANGGGGGNSHNSGGGGGSNGIPGGFGGYSFEGAPCNVTVPFNNRGIGGYQLNYSTAQNKIFLGGGGGAGQSNNPQGFEARGGNGAGIIIITADKFKANNNKIITNGNEGLNCGTATDGCHEGMGGGGAAGTTLLNINTYLDNTIVETKGGKGADMTSPGNLKVGPGGGGSGGISWIKQAAVPANLVIINSGGVNGVCTGYANNPWGATPGGNGNSLTNLTLPIDNTPFKPNIDSVRFTPDPTACRSFDFDGFGYTNTHPVTSWNWYFGDGGTANTQNTSHTYTSTGTFNVKLVVTDINGCKDSVTRQVNTNTINVFAGNDASYCSNGTVTHTLNGSGDGTTYNWQPAALLNDNTLPNPVATITATTKFYLTQTDPLGCSAVDSVIITVNPVPLVTSFADTAFCANTSLTLSASGAATYSWSPAAAVNDPASPNPLFTGTSNQTMTVTGTNAQGCSASSSFDVTIKAIPVVATIPDSTICNTQSIVLTTSGAQTYSWSPAVNLSDPSAESPIFNGSTGNTYTVTGTAANGCSNTDVIVITTKAPGVFNTPPNAAVCINSTVTLNGNNGTGVTYLWSPAATLSNPSAMNPVATPAVTGINNYTVLISEPICNSSRSFIVNVMVNPLPDVNATRSNDLDCTIRSSTLSATGAVQYSWTPAATLSSSTGPNPVATPANDTKYVVTGTDANGCKNKDSVVVLVKGTDGRYDIPNSFTPNGDGKNDCFGVKHWGDATGFHFMIFNRWGEKVFETNNVNQCWNGRYKGQQADVGGYVYYIKSVNLCGETIKKGNVLLIR